MKCVGLALDRPANNNNGAGRQQNWYIKQQAFYDGYHQAFEACVKILTICLPNGMTAAVVCMVQHQEERVTWLCGGWLNLMTSYWTCCVDSTMATCCMLLMEMTSLLDIGTVSLNKAQAYS
jgi:hypothetical protein